MTVFAVYRDRVFRFYQGVDQLNFLLPIYIDELLHAGKAEVKVLPTDAEWFGVTYQEDKASVTEAFRKLIADGVYSEKLYD